MTDPTSDHTVVAVLTPPGRGAVATIVVEGTRATPYVAAHYQPHGGGSLDALPIGRISVGRFGPPPGEEIVVSRRDERRIELHCHGGEVAAGAIRATLVEAGCESCDWQTWITDSATNTIQAEALAAMALASTTRTANVLLAQYHGALEQAARHLISQLTNDDGSIVQSAADRLDALMARYHWGQHLTVPWRIVIAGRPNVGKSSLTNRLVGYQRALVSGEPGTTRDVVWAATAIDGWPVELADTAGLRPGESEIESLGIERARAQLAGADLVILVSDASEPPTVQDVALRHDWPDAMLVANKIDLVEQDVPADGIATSALTGEGIDAFLAEIAARLLPGPTQPTDAFIPQAVPFTRRQHACLQAAAEAITDQQTVASVQKAIESLRRLVKENTCIC